MNEEYISIAKFAELAKVSRQAVYSQLDKKLSEYVKVVDSKKLISTNGLSVFGQAKTVNECQDNVNQMSSMFTALNSTIEILQKQLEIKDKQIADLNDRLSQALTNQSQSNYITAQKQAPALAPAENRRSFWGRKKK